MSLELGTLGLQAHVFSWAVCPGCACGCRSDSPAGGAKLGGWLLVHLSSSTDCVETQRDARPVWQRLLMRNNVTFKNRVVLSSLKSRKLGTCARTKSWSCGLPLSIPICTLKHETFPSRCAGAAQRSPCLGCRAGSRHLLDRHGPSASFGLCPAGAGCLIKATYCSSCGEPGICNKLSCYPCVVTGVAHLISVVFRIQLLPGFLTQIFHFNP